MKSLTKKLLTLLFVAAYIPLVGCTFGTVGSVGIPAESPYEVVGTTFASTYGDLSAGLSGVAIDSDLFIEDEDEGLFFYVLLVLLDREGGGAAGSVQLVSESEGVVGAIALTIGNPSIDISAGFSEGLVPTSDGGPLNDPGDVASVFLGPSWDAVEEGFVCVDGTGDCEFDETPENVIGACVPELESEEFDWFLVRIDAPPGIYPGLCGDVPVTYTINPPFDTVGECISTLKAERCSGLRGRDRAACNHAQIGVCHASFNVPSSHNPN